MYIDGVRFVLPKRYELMLRQAFENITTGIGMRINQEPGNKPHKRGVFLSQSYDLSDPNRIKCGIADKARTKVVEALDQLVAKNLTWASARAAFGRIFWAMEVLAIKWHSFYHLKDFYRRKASEFSTSSVRGARSAEESAPLIIWPSVLEELSALRSHLVDPLSHVIVTRLPGTPQVALFTDASNAGYGAVLRLAGGDWVPFRGRWSTAESGLSINVLEAKAANLAVIHFARELRGKDVHLVVDNTATKFSVIKGESRAFILNDEVSALHRRLRELKSWDVRYIESEANPADEPSRDLPLDHQKVRSAWRDCRRLGVVCFRSFGRP